MKLTGPQRAAVVFTQLDDTRAHALLRALSENDAVHLLAEVAHLPLLTSGDVAAIMTDFAGQTAAYKQVRQGGVEVARRWLEERVGSTRASEILSEVEIARVTRPMGFLNTIDPSLIAGFLSEEHPQIAALVLAYIDAEHAAKVLDRFDRDRATDVVRRIAMIGPVPASIVQWVADGLESRLSALMRAGMGEDAAGGVAAAAAVLNNVDRASEKEVLAMLESSNPELAEDIRNEMFVFDDVLALDDVALQVVLRSVGLRDMALAIKVAGQDVVDKFTHNLSERVAADLIEELQSLGPQRISALEAAQNVVVRAARDLADSGAITIARANDEIVV